MKTIWWLIILLIWLIVGGFLSCKYLCTPAVVVPADNCSTWEINDGRSLDLDNANHIHFRRNSSAHLTNYTGVNNTMTQVANYLKQNSSKALTITGLYDSTEVNKNPFMANLGLARADDVKRWLTGLSVPANQINTNSKVSEYKCFRNDTLRRGATFAFGNLTKDNNRIAAIKNRLFGKPVMLYFNTGSDVPIIGNQERTDFADLFYYLDNVTGSKLDVEGHTDNAGNQANNVTLSQSRANDVKNFIMTNGGVGGQRMDTNGFGPNNPIAPNDTPDNMAKNRRVEVTLK